MSPLIASFDNPSIPAISINETVQNDARGSVFQLTDSLDRSGIAVNDDKTYKGNVVADLQLMVAKAIHDEVLTDTPALQTVHNTLDPELVAWAESGTQALDVEYCCNGDSMHHVMKGIIAIRVDDTQGFDISRNTIQNVENLSLPPYDNCAMFHPGSSEENDVLRQAGDIRAISAAATRGFDGALYSVISDNVIRQVKSLNGKYVLGIDIQGESQGVTVNRNNVDLMSDIGDDSDEYIAIRVRENVDGPTIKVGKDNICRQKVENLAPQTGLRTKKFNHPYIPEMYVLGTSCFCVAAIPFHLTYLIPLLLQRVAKRRLPFRPCSWSSSPLLRETISISNQ